MSNRVVGMRMDRPTIEGITTTVRLRFSTNFQGVELPVWTDTQDQNLLPIVIFTKNLR